MREPYEVRLADFQGSLDLLLHLVRSAKMNIEEIPLAEVTDQYLAYMNQVDEVDMERASDFLETASALILIKSRSLLPEPASAEEGEEPDPEVELRQRLRLYAIFQSAAGPLRRREESGARYFYKLPEDLYSEEAGARLVNADAAALRDVYAALAGRSGRAPQPEPTHHVTPEVYSVRRQKQRLLLRLEEGPFSFADFFDAAAKRLEIVVTFMALLELWGAGLLRLEQSRPFASIEIAGEGGS